MGIQHDNLLYALGMRINRMDMQVAEARRQRALLVRRNRLVAQKQHLMAQQRVIELFKLGVAERPG